MLANVGPLAQSAERGANNAKVMSSKLIRTIRVFLLFGFLYIELCNNLVQPLVANVGPLAHSAECCANNAKVMSSKLIRTKRVFLLFCFL